MHLSFIFCLTETDKSHLIISNEASGKSYSFPTNLKTFSLLQSTHYPFWKPWSNLVLAEVFYWFKINQQKHHEKASEPGHINMYCIQQTFVLKAHCIVLFSAENKRLNQLLWVHNQRKEGNKSSTPPLWERIFWAHP